MCEGCFSITQWERHGDAAAGGPCGRVVFRGLSWRAFWRSRILLHGPLDARRTGPLPEDAAGEHPRLLRGRGHGPGRPCTVIVGPDISAAALPDGEQEKCAGARCN